MGKGAPKAPAAPDPAATAAAQTATNKETAYWNAALNNVNQITPYGSLTYKQTGGGPQYNMEAYNSALSAFNNSAASGNVGSNSANQWTYDGYNYEIKDGNLLRNGTNIGVWNPNAIGAGQYGAPTGAGTSAGGGGATMPQLKDFLISDDAPPQFTSTIELTPEQQAILDRQTSNQKALVDLGGEQLGRIRDSVSTPFSFGALPSYGEQDQTAASARAEEALMSRMNPQFQRDEEAMRTRLINQGIGQGSQAYNTEMERFNQAKNDARMQAVLSGQQYGSTELADALRRRNQGIQEYTTQRNAPLNEYIGLTSGVQVQSPQFNSQNYQGTQPVDYAGLLNNQYQAQLGQYNSKVASNNSTTGGILGLGGSLLGSFAAPGGLFGFSDSRLKQDIMEIGEENGHKLYEFSYIPKVKKSGRFIGVMAQDVEKYMPEAVIEVEGFKAVNYSMLGLQMREVA